MSDDVPDEVKPYLDEIADRLWSDSATVMVGAGFSRNAEPVGPVSESFPDWKTLGDLFYRKLYGKPPGEDARYLSLLRLAEQVQAAFGRPALDRMLLRAIPDLRFEPSRLHNMLLRLPWEDVFTTNYDTLLERARASVTRKHYQVVATKDDLLQATGRRIVKLHGSFPSPPFVITEEDYRRYPLEHAPFVNTVRQSLLEKTLCLVGFSGDDPNFLQWIGWIRDQVGKETAPKIYLVGVFETMSEADRKLLNGRGIVPVDLSGFSTDPGAALRSFLAYLEGRRTRALEWPKGSADTEPWADEGGPGKYRKAAAEWRRQRGRYPGWVVMPEDRRRSLWGDTQNWLSSVTHMSAEDREAMETPVDLEFAFELTWRLDRCLVPLTGETPVFLEAVATKYGDANVPIPKEPHWSRASVFEAVAIIRLWLLRHYREQGLEEKWESARTAINRDVDKLLPEHRARLQLEAALQALYRFDPVEARRLLIEWQSNDNVPFWEAKRAALMAELGEANAARSILESSLAAIRRQQSLTPVGDDYTLVSQESVVMLLLWAVERGMSLSKPSSNDSDLLDELSERWNELTRYKCDPRREIESFSTRLRHPPAAWHEETTSHEFDLGMVSKTGHFGLDEEAIAAYGLLRLYEDIGIPYRMENVSFVDEPVKATLARVGPYSPHWALANVVRLGDAKAANWLFNREFVARLGPDEADQYFEVYLSVLERTVDMIDNPGLSEAKTYESLANTLPEVFSRLCYKCSPNCRERLMAALGRVYGSKGRHTFAGVHNLARRLFDSMSVEELIRAVPLLIDFPVPDPLGDFDEREFVNPLRLVNLPAGIRDEALKVPDKRIDQLLDRLANQGWDADWVSTSLVWLQDRGKLNVSQSKRLGDSLWDGMESSGVPVVPGFYSFACMRLPYPAEVEPDARVKEHLRTTISAKMGSSGLGDVLDELRHSAGVVDWSWSEATELMAILRAWWDESKYRLGWHMPTPFGSPANELKQTTWKAVSALSAVFAQRTTSGDRGQREEVPHDFIADLATQGIAVTRLQVAILDKATDRRAELIDRVAAQLVDSTKDQVVDALFAARLLAIAAGQGLKSEFAQVGTMLVQGVEWRHRPGLVDRLRLVEALVNDHPWFLSARTEHGLLRGLEQIADETSQGVKGNDEDGVILIRAAAASLAFGLFLYYRELEKDEPETVQRWQAICTDPNEFAEVKNAWIGATVPKRGQ